MANLSYIDAVNSAVNEIQSELQERISQLLECKHLYQRVRVDYKGIREKYQAPLPKKIEMNITPRVNEHFSGSIELIPEGGQSIHGGGPHYVTKNLKLFCPHCGCREVSNCVWRHDLGEYDPFSGASIAHLLPKKKNYQGLFLAYQCLRCKSDPILFVIRREDWTFILDGRSPMEDVEVPNMIPNEERVYFKESIVAYQSGKALPGILYLRVFIERFCRRLTGITTKESGDEITMQYGKLIPPEKSSHMPSLKEWYGRLSEAIHEGREDSALYREAQAEIIRHFEFRRMFKLDSQDQ